LFKRIVFAEKYLRFLYAELKKQELGLQLTTEVGLCCAITVITKCWRHILVSDIGAWILALIVAASAHAQQQITICIVTVWLV
jgi:hypothetical protein